jgi:hypothetical protein
MMAFVGIIWHYFDAQINKIVGWMVSKWLVGKD